MPTPASTGAATQMTSAQRSEPRRLPNPGSHSDAKRAGSGTSTPPIDTDEPKLMTSPTIIAATMPATTASRARVGASMRDARVRARATADSTIPAAASTSTVTGNS